jgi:ligand-binding sensor domain-containing protein
MRANLRRAILWSLFVICASVARWPGRAQLEGGAVIGLVQDEQGAPVADAKVTLTSMNFSASALTQSDGRFEFRGLRSAQYVLAVQAAGFRKETFKLILGRAGEVITQLVRLRPSSLHVMAFDVASRQPLGGVSISLYARDRAQSANPVARSKTDESGDAYFGRLLPGTYQLAASLPGYDEYSGEVFISSGLVTTEFTLPLSVAPVIPMNDRAIWRYTVPSLPSKNVQAVFQDSDAWIWLGTDKGAVRFNGSDFKSLSQAALSGLDVRSIAEDGAGRIWLATPRGVKLLNKSGADAGELLPDCDVRQVIRDSRGRVWAAAAQGLFRFDGGQIERLLQEDVLVMAEDRGGKLWIVTPREIIFFEGNRFEKLKQEPKEAGRIHSIFVDRAGAIWIAAERGVWSLGGEPLQAIPDLARAIAQDPSGRLWIALERGTIIYDPAERQYQRVMPLERDRVNAIMADREGNIWLATDNGAARADPYSFVNFNTSRGLPDNEAWMIAQDPKSKQLYFATSGGISLMQGERIVPFERFGINMSVRALAFDGRGAAWIGTEQGIFWLSGQTLMQFKEESGLASNNVRWVAGAAGSSMIAIATSRGVSLFKDGAMHRLEELAGYDVRHVFEDSDGKLWFSTSRGIVVYDPGADSTERFDPGPDAASADTRSVTRWRGSLVAATRAGVRYYIGNSSPVTLDSEPASALFVDRDGYLWVGTDDGQVKKMAIIGSEVVSAIYSGQENALSGGRINSITEDDAGRIWIATATGCVRHVPNRAVLPTKITLEAEGRTVEPDASGQYQLPYGLHNLTFRFAAVSTSGQVRYFYRIRDRAGQSAWMPLPLQQSSEREISLDMSEGDHVFEVMALNRDLYGMQGPAASISLRVSAPFWKRWWFHALAAALIAFFAAAVVVLHRMRRREYVLPKELRHFVPIEPNPYIVGNPIRTEKMFYGREDDFRYVRTKLEGANQGVVIVFCGERRVGKSSILYQLLNGRLGERFIPVFVDMQEMVISSDAEFFGRVSKLIADSVNRALGGRATAPTFDGRNPYPIFADFLDQVLQNIGDRTLLILVDEYELMESKVDEGKLSSELMTFLAGLMDSKERLALIFTGSRRLEERDRKYWRELLRRSLFRKIGFLSEKDTERLITEPVAGRVVYGRGVVSRIYRLTAGQPFYTQVICQNVVDHLNERRQNWVTMSDLSSVVEDILDNPLPQMIYAWEGLSDDEKLVLSLLAEALPDGESYAGAAALRASVKTNNYPVNLSENTIRLTLEEMFRRDMLDKDAADGFRFKMDLFRLWIRRSHSIWQVINEVRTL